MILPTLIDYYDRLAADPAVGDLPPFGYAIASVSFDIVISTKGEFEEIIDIRIPQERARGGPVMQPRRMVVPGVAPRTSGIHPYLLCDTPEYLLGVGKRSAVKFKECKARHLIAREYIGHEWFEAVCLFLQGWDPSGFEPPDEWDDIQKYRGCFRIEGDRKLRVHDEPQIRDALGARTAARLDWPRENVTGAVSLVTGRDSTIPNTHAPQVQGVKNAQPTGAALASFNFTAAEHYSKEQTFNAPVAMEEAFKYCTALNRLLADQSRRAQVGDMTVVWWADAPLGGGERHEGEALFAALFAGGPSESKDAENDATVQRLRDAVGRISKGLMPTGLTGLERGFHVLGLSPNAARLSVRLWWSGTLREMLANIAQHHTDAALEPVPPRDEHRPLSIWRMVRETARVHGDRPDMDTVSPTLAGELTRAVLCGGLYPRSLLDAIVRRVRTEGLVSHARASITKACITRRRRVLAGRSGHAEEVLVSLNKDGQQAYQLGRLFAALEKTQADALGTIDASIRDRYFGSASSTPASVFPRLIRLSQHHMGKLDGGHKVSREKLMQEICAKLDRFPAHLDLESQGLFQIGYYHQRQDFYTPKNAGQNDVTEHHTADQAGEE
ncbi:MAG: type I-C CRISPR-associated protein Cas8c/Csd1 [Phycisphaerales bacterium]|nr:type I-C CRISPR-associated protein Cas8c/Csd1 [Phycisphaerales bacterium]